jgi:small-conductance mechanosensitive channel
MPRKTEKEIQDARVEAAIRDLYTKLPASRYGEPETEKTADLRRKVKQRETLLQADKLLSKLRIQLEQAEAEATENSKTNRRHIDSLLNRFRLRGVSPKLIDDIEKLTTELTK